jgi:hypothetical protein
MEEQAKFGSVILKEARDIKKSGLDFKKISSIIKFGTKFWTNS